MITLPFNYILKDNAVGKIYDSKAGITPVITDGVIDPKKLTPKNVRVTKTNNEWSGKFDVDPHTANKLIKSGGEWTLTVESNEIGLAMYVTPDNITAEFVEYSNGTFTVTGDALAIAPQAAEGTYEGYGEYNDGVGDAYDYEDVTITVIDNSPEIDPSKLAPTDVTLIETESDVYRLQFTVDSEIEKFMDLENWSVELKCTAIDMVADVTAELITSGDVTYSSNTITCSGDAFTVDATKVTQSSYGCSATYKVDGLTYVGFQNLTMTVSPIEAIQGIQGIQGLQGIQGIQGLQGVQGIQGLQGE